MGKGGREESEPVNTKVGTLLHTILHKECDVTGTSKPVCNQNSSWDKKVADKQCGTEGMRVVKGERGKWEGGYGHRGGGEFPRI